MRFKALFLGILAVIIYHGIVNDIEALEFSVSSKAAKAGKAASGEMIIEIKRGVIELGKERGIVPLELVNVKSELIKSLNKKYGLVSVERLFSGTRKDEPSDIYLFRFPSTVNIKELVAAYKKDSDVIYAEPNYLVRALREEKE